MGQKISSLIPEGSGFASVSLMIAGKSAALSSPTKSEGGIPEIGCVMYLLLTSSLRLLLSVLSEQVLEAYSNRLSGFVEGTGEF